MTRASPNRTAKRGAAFITALTATNQLDTVEQRQARAADEREHWLAIRTVEFAAQAAFHRAHAAYYDALLEGDEDGNNRENVCAILLDAIDSYLAIPARTKEDCRDRARNVRKWGRTFGGLFVLLEEYRRRQQGWHAMLRRDAAWHCVALKLDA